MTKTTADYELNRLGNRLQTYYKTPLKKVAIEFEDCVVVWIGAQRRRSAKGKRFCVRGHFRVLKKKVAIYKICEIPQVIEATS